MLAENPASRTCNCGVMTSSPSGLCETCTAYPYGKPPIGGWTASELMGILRRAARPYASGSQNGLEGFCRAHGALSSRPRLHDFLMGRQPSPPRRILSALGLEIRYGPTTHDAE